MKATIRELKAEVKNILPEIMKTRAGIPEPPKAKRFLDRDNRIQKVMSNREFMEEKEFLESLASNLELK